MARRKLGTGKRVCGETAHPRKVCTWIFDGDPTVPRSAVDRFETLVGRFEFDFDRFETVVGRLEYDFDGFETVVGRLEYDFDRFETVVDRFETVVDRFETVVGCFHSLIIGLRWAGRAPLARGGEESACVVLHGGMIAALAWTDTRETG